MAENKTFYVTTPIYYPSDKLHIGHSYTTVAADTIARYKKLRGYDVKFLTGTDEHGQKIERVAKASGVTPKEYTDKVVAWIKELWKLMDIEYDIFIRTTDEYHIKAVQKIFKKLYDKGDIYKGFYEGLYCAQCETFYTERQLKEGNCPDCGRPAETVKEEAYFFRLSKYQDRLIEHLEKNPDFIMPQTRKNEMINNFLKPGLEDLSVSRTSFNWGVPVEFDPGHVVYVWLDALSNYVTALGFMSDDDTEYKKYWPADVHLMAKEIVRFHSIIWPAILMALDEPLPKQIFGHGWLNIDGGKMSKSKGNVVDPKILVEKYGVDAIRYFLLRDLSFGQDGNFTNEALILRINSDLANDLGNLLSRTVGMIEKYFDKSLPQEQKDNEFDQAIVKLSLETIEKVEAFMDKLSFSDALSEIWTFIRRTNKYIDETMPWVLAKDPEKQPELAGIMYTLCESLRIIAVLIEAFMPNTPKAIRTQLCINEPHLYSWDSTKTFGALPRTVKVLKGSIVFPRIDMEKDLKELEAAAQSARKDSVASKESALNPQEDNQEEQKSEITIDDFDKLDLKVGEVIACEKVEGSKKLLKSQVQIGNETRQILSGIGKYYTPEMMLHKKVVVITNLKPVKLMGHLSQGMILAATDQEGNLNVISPDGAVKSGAQVS